MLGRHKYEASMPEAMPAIIKIAGLLMTPPGRLSGMSVLYYKWNIFTSFSLVIYVLFMI